MDAELTISAGTVAGSASPATRWRRACVAVVGLATMAVLGWYGVREIVCRAHVANLRSRSRAVREEAAAALAAWRYRPAVDALAAVLLDEGEPVRPQDAWSWPGEAGRHYAGRALRTLGPTAGIAVLDALSARGDRYAGPGLERLVAEVCRSEPELLAEWLLASQGPAATRRVAFTAAATVVEADKSRWELLFRGLRDADDSIRLLAARLLDVEGVPPTVIDEVVTLFREELHPAVFHELARTLFARMHTDQVETLLAVFTTTSDRVTDVHWRRLAHPPSRLCSMAAEAGTDAALALLDQLACHPLPSWRSGAVRALREVEDDDARAAGLERALHDEIDSVAASALWLFDERPLDRSEIVTQVVRLVEDADRKEIPGGVRGLRTIGIELRAQLCYAIVAAHERNIASVIPPRPLKDRVAALEALLDVESPQTWPPDLIDAGLAAHIVTSEPRWRTAERLDILLSSVGPEAVPAIRRECGPDLERSPERSVQLVTALLEIEAKNVRASEVLHDALPARCLVHALCDEDASNGARRALERRLGGIGAQPLSHEELERLLSTEVASRCWHGEERRRADLRRQLDDRLQAATSDSDAMKALLAEPFDDTEWSLVEAWFVSRGTATLLEIASESQRAARLLHTTVATKKLVECLCHGWLGPAVRRALDERVQTGRDSASGVAAHIAELGAEECDARSLDGGVTIDEVPRLPAWR